MKLCFQTSGNSIEKIKTAVNRLLLVSKMKRSSIWGKFSLLLKPKVVYLRPSTLKNILNKDILVGIFENIAKTSIYNFVHKALVYSKNLLSESILFGSDVIFSCFIARKYLHSYFIFRLKSKNLWYKMYSKLMLISTL